MNLPRLPMGLGWRRLLICITLGITGVSISAIELNASADSSLSDQLVYWIPTNNESLLGAAARTGAGEQRNCDDDLEGLTVGRCGDNDFVLLLNNLSPCSVDQRVSCIERLEIRSETGDWEAATYLGQSGRPPVAWSSIPELDLGPASTASLFVTERPGASPRLWAVSAHYMLYRRDLEGSNPGPRGLNLSITPVTEAAVDQCLSVTDSDFFELRTQYVFNLAGLERRYWRCYKRLNEATEFRGRMTLNLRRIPRGWITSYLRDVEARIIPVETGRSQIGLTIEGTSTRIPTTAISNLRTDDLKLEKLCSTLSSQFPPARPALCDQDLLGKGVKSSWGNSTVGQSPEASLRQYSGLVQEFPELDEARSEMITWGAIVTLATDQDWRLKGCPAPNNLYGVVGTNSMIVDSNYPRWDPTDDSFKFTVASPHRLPNGELTEGHYEFQLDTNVAQCLWQTKITPQNVVLSVLDERGATKVAVASVSVRNGLVIFRATGFTYSTTTLRAFLKKAEPTKATTKAKPGGRINCTKDGVKKLQPKGVTTCPKGWRRK